MRRWTVAGLVALVLIGAVFALRPWGGSEPDKPVPPGTTPSAGATPEAPLSAPDGGTPGAAGTTDPGAAAAGLAVEGRVLDERRFPVAGTSVAGFVGEEPLTPARAGPDGRFRVAEIPESAKAVTLIATAPDGRVGFAVVGVLKARPVTIVVRAGHALVVRTLSDGAPLAGVRLIPVSDRHVFPFATSDDAGLARLPVLPARTWRLIGIADGLRGELQVALPREQGGPVDLELLPTRRIRVVAVEKGTEKPVEGATFTVAVERRRPGAITLSLGVGLPAPSPTDAKGVTWIEGTLPDARIRLKDLRAPGYAARHFRHENVRVGPKETEVRIEFDPPQTLRFPVVAGEAPVPAPGAELRLIESPGSGSPPPPETARMEGTEIVVAGVGSNYFHAIAIAPDGSLARLFAQSAEEGGRETSFRRPRTLTVIARDEGGNPVAGIPFVLRNQGNNALADPVATDAAGVARLERLYGGRAEVYQLPEGSSSAWGGRVVGTVDLDAGNATVEATVGRERDFVVRVTLDGEPGLPAAYYLAVGNTGIHDTDEDPAAGELRFRTRVPPGAETVVVRLTALSQPPQTTTVEVPAGDAAILAAIAITFGSELLVRVGLPADGRFELMLERKQGEGWARHYTGTFGGIELDAEGRARIPALPAGTYRLADLGSGLRSPEVVLGDTPVQAELDLSRTGWVKGRIEVSAGAEVAGAKVVVMAEGLGDASPAIVWRTGKFMVRVPGDRPVRVTVSHPTLVPATEGGSIDLTEPREDVVLHLVRGATARFRPTPTPRPGYRQNIPVRLYEGPVEGEGLALKAKLDEAGVAEFGGFSPGRYTVWIDAPGFAPAVLRNVELGEDSTDLGDVALEAGAKVVLKIVVPEGQSIPRVYLYAERQGAPTYRRSINSNGKSAEVALTGLGPGRYRIRAHPIMGSTGKSLDVEREVAADSTIELTIDLR